MSTALDYARVLLPHPGRTTPLSLDEYRAEDGYAGWHKALNTMTPDEVVEQVKAAGLRGRGGDGRGRSRQRPRARLSRYAGQRAHPGVPGRRRLHLRRRDGIARVTRRSPTDAALAAALSRGRRSVPAAHGHQQR